VVDVVVLLDPTVNLFPFVTIVLSRDDTYRRYIGVVLPVNLLKYY
jgi:general stress protein CsbA